jgi:hypothetical protein
MRISLVILALIVAFYVKAQDTSESDEGYLHLGFSLGQVTFKNPSNQLLNVSSTNPTIEIGKVGKVNIGGLIFINPTTFGDSLFRTQGLFEVGYSLEQSFANDKFYFKEGINLNIPFRNGYRFYGQLGVKAKSVGVDFNIQLSQMILPGFYNPLLMQFGIRFSGR